MIDNFYYKIFALHLIAYKINFLSLINSYFAYSKKYPNYSIDVKTISLSALNFIFENLSANPFIFTAFNMNSLSFINC